MEQDEKLLKDYSDLEKGSYLGAIASIATADRAASEEELEYIEALADSAELSEQQKEAVQKAATELSGEELEKCLDNLKNSELRFSLITDLIAFAESDQHYTQGKTKPGYRCISTCYGNCRFRHDMYWKQYNSYSFKWGFLQLYMESGYRIVSYYGSKCNSKPVSYYNLYGDRYFYRKSKLYQNNYCYSNC